MGIYRVAGSDDMCARLLRERATRRAWVGRCRCCGDRCKQSQSGSCGNKASSDGSSSLVLLPLREPPTRKPRYGTRMGSRLLAQIRAQIPA